MPVPLDDDRDRDRWAELRLESGDLVIYDVEEPTAWIRSEGAVPLSALA